MRRLLSIVAAFSSLAATSSTTRSAATLAYAPAPPDNPLKGFVPYLGSRTNFPHSLEWDYTQLSELMTGILPGEPPACWSYQADTRPFPPGAYHLLLRVPNPLPNGPPVRFANQAQDRPLRGWLTLGETRW
jgi:hypothetical protein